MNIISRLRKYLQKKFPLPQPKEVKSRELSQIRKDSKTKKYIPCLAGNKHTPVIAKKKGKNEHHLEITHGAFALWFKTIIMCSVCGKAIEWERQNVLPAYWDDIDPEKADKVEK